MTNKILIVVFVLASKFCLGQNCNCDSLFIQTKQIIEDNYAGWFDKVKPENKNLYTEWTSNKYLEAKTINNDSVCAKTLQEWISYFKDKHLRIRFTKPKTVNSVTKVTSDKIEILTTNLTETQINSYFAKTNILDPIEGIYIHPSYRLAITKIKPNIFYATILTTKNENWKQGEVKLVITKNAKQYSGVFYEGDKSDISKHIVKLVDNILDFDIVFFEKLSPNVKVKRDVKEYEMGKDKYATSLKFENDVAIWKFPSFENNAYEQTDYLVKKYKDKLEVTPYWVLDMSNNSGGDYSIGLQLLDYIYTKPIISYNTEMRMTKSNYEVWYSSYISNYYDGLDSLGKSKLDLRLNRMKANYGKMYNEDGKKTDTIKIEKLKLFPKRIALLINENTVSSGELFTLIAKQSDKVIVMGQNSGGMMDYGNIVNYKTNCSTIRIQLPTNRQLWLEEGFSIDKEGLKPDIYLTNTNWTEQAIKKLRK